MKLFSILFLTACSLFMVSCKETNNNKEPEYVPVNLPKEEAPMADGYYCPMKCEGNKVYQDKHKPCPVCEMKLVHTK